MKNKISFCKVAEVIVLSLTLLIMLLFTVGSFLYRFYPETVDEHMSENVLFLLLGITAFAGLTFLLGRLIGLLKKKIKYGDWLLFALFLIIWNIAAIAFVIGAKEKPSSDSYACFELAKSFKNSDFSAVVPKDSYLSLWPFQTGLIFILEKMMRLFNTTEPVFFQIVNVVFIMIGMTSGYGLLKEFTDKEYALSAYMLLTFLDLVTIIEAPQVYGNIPCFNLTVFSLWMFYRMYNRKYWFIYGIPGSLAIIIASVYKGNAKIFAIALIIVSVLSIIKAAKKNRKKALLALLAAGMCFVSASLPQSYYESYAGNTLGKGVPAVGYIAMGLQGRGGWNGFHSNTFMETGYDYEKTSDISRQAIGESLEEFKADPKRAFDFFFGKICGQWCYETRAAYWNVGVLWDEPRSDFALSLIEGDGRKAVDFIANIRLSIVYLCELLGTVLFFKKRNERLSDNEYDYIWYIFLIGGFLFSVLWEAHAEYVSPYINAILPISLAMIFNIKKVRSGK